MGLSLAMKDNRDGNCETESNDGNLLRSRRADIISDNGSRPASVQMVDRPSDPILTEPTSDTKLPTQAEETSNFNSIFKEWKSILFVSSILLLVFGLCLVLYCMVNFTEVGLMQFLTTIGFSIIFDSFIQLVILIGISARQVNCEVN